MIVRWGRKGLIAGAYAVTFVTAVSSVSYINEVQARPSFKQEVKFVTPVSASVNTINRVQIRPDIKFEFRHLTPVSASVNTVNRVQIRPDVKFEFRHLTPVETIDIIETAGGSGYPAWVKVQNKEVFSEKEAYATLRKMRERVEQRGISARVLKKREKELNIAESEVVKRLGRRYAEIIGEKYDNLTGFVDALRFSESLGEMSEEDMEQILLILLIDEVT